MSDADIDYSDIPATDRKFWANASRASYAVSAKLAPPSRARGVASVRAKETDVQRLLKSARSVEIGYRRLTGRRLGIVGEIGEVEAALRLGLDLSARGQAGFDARDGKGRRVQIKTRCLSRHERLSGRRLGKIRKERDYDVVVLVLLDDNLQPVVMYQADRSAVTRAGTRAAGIHISTFIRLAHQVWPSAAVEWYRPRSAISPTKAAA